MVSAGVVLPSLTLVVVALGMVALAAVDVWCEKVFDLSICALAAATVVALHIDGITGTQWVWAALTAVCVFIVYLEMGTFGIMGGGDVKLSVVPAAVLGAVNPVLGLWWLALAFSLQGSLGYVSRMSARQGTERMALPHVPAMAAATVAAGAFAGAQIFLG